MADFNPINIPPQGIGPVDPSSGQKPSPKQAEGTPGFQDILKQQLGELSRETDEVASASNPTFEDMAEVMNNAKNVFEDTMQTHQLLQQMINKLPEDQAASDEEK